MPKIKKNCEWCNKEFESYPSRKQKFCSVECVKNYQKGTNHPNWKGKVEKTCQACGKQFFVYVYRKETAKFCSFECTKNQVIVCCAHCGKEFSMKYKQSISHSLHFCSRKCHADYGALMIECKQCKKIFRAKKSLVERKKFCSKKCLYNWISKNFIGEKRYNWKPKIIKTCPNCSNKFEVDQYRIESNRGIYCSKKCQTEYMVLENSPGWKGGISFEPYPTSFNDRFKLEIRERDGYICQICGKDDANTVHHIDYDKENTTKKNCIVVCRYCHGITNSDREIWQEYLESIQNER